MHCAVLSLAYYDARQDMDEVKRSISGYIMIGSIGLVFLCSLYFVWKENFVILRKIVEFMKNKFAKKVKKPKIIERKFRRKTKVIMIEELNERPRKAKFARRKFD